MSETPQEQSTAGYTPTPPPPHDLDWLRKVLAEKQKASQDATAKIEELKPAITGLSQAVNGIEGIIKAYEKKRAEYLNQQKQLGCFRDAAILRVPEPEIKRAGEAVVAVDSIIEAARLKHVAAASGASTKKAELDEAVAASAAKAAAYDRLAKKGATIEALLGEMKKRETLATNAEKEGKLALDAFYLDELKTLLAQLAAEGIPAVKDLESALVDAQAAAAQAAEAVIKKKSIYEDAADAADAAKKEYEALVASRVKDIVARLS